MFLKNEITMQIFFSDLLLSVTLCVSTLVIFFCFLDFFFLFFRAAPVAYGVLANAFQARGLIGATAADLYHSHGNTASELCLQPTPWLMATLDP